MRKTPVDFDLIALAILLLSTATIVAVAVRGPLEANPSEALSFWGAIFGGLIGGGFTAFAGWLAWSAAHDQIDAAHQRERDRITDAYGLLYRYADGLLEKAREIKKEGRILLKRDSAGAVEGYTTNFIVSSGRQMLGEFDNRRGGITKNDMNSQAPSIPLLVREEMRMLMRKDDSLRASILSLIERYESQENYFVTEEIFGALSITMEAEELQREAESVLFLLKKIDDDSNDMRRFTTMSSDYKNS